MWDLLNTEFREVDSGLLAVIAERIQKMRRYWLKLQISHLYKIKASRSSDVHYSEEYGY